MSCQEYEADIVDVARGAGVGAEVESRLRAHLDACAGCSARFTQEQLLTAALREVAESAAAPSRSDAIEAHLLRVFAERHHVEGRRGPAPRSAVLRPAAWRWLAAAAVVVLAAALWRGATGWRQEREAAPTASHVAAAPAAAVPPAAATVPAAPRPVEAADRERASNLSPNAASARGPARTAPVRPAGPAGDEPVLRFVSLPTAVGLPELESGRIVRVELATAVLPAYGIDVAPDSEAGVVEAEVLVGQDGQPRAIRFVNSRMDTRRQQ